MSRFGVTGLLALVLSAAGPTPSHATAPTAAKASASGRGPGKSTTKPAPLKGTPGKPVGAPAANGKSAGAKTSTGKPVLSKTAAPKATPVAAKSGGKATAKTARVLAAQGRSPGTGRAPGTKLGAPSGPPDDVPAISSEDRDRERILRLQDSLSAILNGPTLKRLRVGLRVLDARSGRTFYGRRSAVLMDPASNQKVLATTAALVRLGGDWRYRTELTGPEPDARGAIPGDVFLRGSGDPTIVAADLEEMAAALARRGVTRIDGAIIGDTRRLGDDDALTRAPGERPPLIVNRGRLFVRVRPGATAGAPPEVTTNPADDSFRVRVAAKTTPKGRARITVKVSVVEGRIQVDVAGRIPVTHGGLAVRRPVANPGLYTAVLLRAALSAQGITVRDPPRYGVPAADAPPPSLLALHRSAPLTVLLRKINKDSNNDQAERMLETLGGEMYGAATLANGLQALREVIAELGLPANGYVPRNGSGLGHANRISADAMAALLRALYLDPRVGPEILQSLSVGGIDGTARNRFKGTLASKRVRVKTGTLRGKSCLSGLVGDGQEVIAFSILVEGLRSRGRLQAVRGAQVSAVNAIMRFVREGAGERIDLPPGFEEAPAPADYEVGEEEMPDTVEENAEPPAPGAPVSAAPKAPAAAGANSEDPLDALLRKDREEHQGSE